MANFEDEKKGTSHVGRVLWIDPNNSNNEMVNTEDLSIKVDFSATEKNRSIIYSDNKTYSTGGSSGSVRFIEGSKINGKSEQPSLTTRYTDAIALDVMNSANNEKKDDYESLGIESINIEFNTAYAPIVIIKFIDVRGNAILSQGNMSKYKMFFQLPYPIFSLKVKGFYGKTVNYCLHLQKWNAAFNSDTGNFEIQAEFIGYTYALLTDMLMGLIRATVRTKRGQAKLNSKKEAYGDNSNLIISIDEMLTGFSDLNYTYKKSNEADELVQQVNAYDSISDDITKIKEAITLAVDSLYAEAGDTYFITQNRNVVGVPDTLDNLKISEKIIQDYDDTVTPLITAINANIKDKIIQLNPDLLKKESLIGIRVTGADLKKEDIAIESFIRGSLGKYSYQNTTDDIASIKEIYTEIKSAIKTAIPTSSSMVITSFRIAYNHIDEMSLELEKNKNDTITKIGEKASTQAQEILGFEPTIRSIFRVLSVNCEVFLETLREVSVEAEGSKPRANELKKVAGKINVNEKQVEDGKIFPWPEYRQKKGNDGYEETWLGSAPGIVKKNVPEILFTEEVHKELLNVARFDKALEEEIQGGDIDGVGVMIKDPWYPISVVDTPISGMLANPYLLVNEKADEALRLLLMRGFLLLSVTNFNSKVNKDMVAIYGQLEAANLYEVAKKTKNGLNVIKQLQLMNNKVAKQQAKFVIQNNGIIGVNTITNPGVGKDEVKPIMKKDGDRYRYIYIYDYADGRGYIPVNKNFDGLVFYNGSTLLPNENIKNLSPDITFVSMPKNLKEFDGRGGQYIYSKPDGSYLFKIIEYNTYVANQLKPTFGSAITDDKYKTLIGKHIDVSTFKSAYIENKKYYIEDANINITEGLLLGVSPLDGYYSTLEIDKLDYTNLTSDTYQKEIGETALPTNPISSSIISFYSENIQVYNEKFGSYLTSKSKTKDYYKNRMPDTENTKFKINFSDKQTSISNNGNINSNSNDDIKRVQRNLDFDDFGKQKSLIESKINDSKVNVYVPFIEFGSGYNNGILLDSTHTFSLFGSKFYNYQANTYVKALLFLHTFPWQGVIIPGDEVSEYAMFDTRHDINKTEDTTYDHETRIFSIKSMFKVNGAFVYAPKAWVLFLGGILWRNNYFNKDGKNVDPIIYRYNSTSLIPTIPYDSNLPKIGNFLYHSENDFKPWGMYFNNDYHAANAKERTNDVYAELDSTLVGLPADIRNYLISYFKAWVDDETIGFKYFQKELEIMYDAGSARYEKAWKNINNAITNDSHLNTSVIKANLSDNKNILTNYNMITTAYNNRNKVDIRNDYKISEKAPYGESKANARPTNNGEYNFNLELRPDTSVMNKLVELLTQGVMVQNCVPSTFIPAEYTNIFDITAPGILYNPIIANAELFDMFIENFFIHLNSTKPDDEVTEDDKTEQDIFGTGDDKTINLLIYRTLSSINDKWLNGTSDDNIFAQCDGSNINPDDIKIASKYRNNPQTAELIDTFRFVDRAFSDIGDKFFLNVKAVSDLIISNYNQSFFDIVNKILIDNNFNFIPLPTFINFNNVDELKTIFTPYSYNDEVGFRGTGPSFVCVFVGQSSVNLDLGVDSVYPDDGLSLSLDDSGAVKLSDETSDFSSELGAGDFNVPVFAVNYGQQNQNYFRSVKLDQREFSETMESLEIIEDISKNGDKSKPTYAGNNLFNVYQTRSYSAEIEMLGSAMIQPMMYFQLNNIPMFRGAYLIYKVTHNIKPHQMTTTVKGNRVKKSKTPLIDKYTMYINLVGRDVNGGTAGIRVGGGSYNSTPGAKFIDTNVNFYWLTSTGEIPTGVDTLGITNKTVVENMGMKSQGNKVEPYMVREVAEVLQKAAYDLHKTNSSIPEAADTIYYNDASRLWGGDIAGHVSHEKGIDIDVRQLFYGKTTAGSPNTNDNGSTGYSRKYTKQFLDILLPLAFRPYTLVGDVNIQYTSTDGTIKEANKGDTISDHRAVEIIWFNDTTLQNELKPKYGAIMESLEHHSNHLHIRFNTPLRVTEETTIGTNTRPATEGNPPISASSGGISATTEPGFLDALKALEAKIGVPTNSLYRIMKHESGLKPSTRNSIGCVGLIQFCPDTDGGSIKTINGKVYNLSDIAAMTGIEQLVVVEAYYKAVIGKVKVIGDLYLYTFIPSIITEGKADSFRIGIQGANTKIWGINQGELYKSNKPFDWNNKGYYDVADVRKRINEYPI